MSCAVFGIDPAPTKKTLVYDGVRWLKWSSQEVRDRVRSVEAPAIIAWDAPLSFDHADFYDRTVDKTVRKWAKEMAMRRRFEASAVNAREFAALSHWALTCDALGMPFGQMPAKFSLAETPPTKNQFEIAIIEVHPAVAIGVLWLEEGVPTPLPRYKGKAHQEGIREIVETLDSFDFPNGATESDDHLDSYVAYRIGTWFRDGKAHWLGDPRAGGYVMPDNPTTDALREQYRIRSGKRGKPQTL